MWTMSALVVAKAGIRDITGTGLERRFRPDSEVDRLGLQYLAASFHQYINE